MTDLVFDKKNEMICAKCKERQPRSWLVPPTDRAEGKAICKPCKKAKKNGS